MQFFKNGGHQMVSEANPLPMAQQRIAAPTFGSGVATAPVAGTVVADTGALGAGEYRVEIVIAIAGALAAGKDLRVEHRDAANAATVRTLGGAPAGGSVALSLPRVTVAEGERIRAVVGAVAGAVGETFHALIAAYPV